MGSSDPLTEESEEAYVEILLNNNHFNEFLRISSVFPLMFKRFIFKGYMKVCEEKDT